MKIMKDTAENRSMLTSDEALLAVLVNITNKEAFLKNRILFVFPGQMAKESISPFAMSLLFCIRSEGAFLLIQFFLTADPKHRERTKKKKKNRYYTREIVFSFFFFVYSLFSF